MRKTISVITRKGQITIPAEARRALGLKEGDKVSIVLEENALKIEPETNWVERTKGILKNRGPAMSIAEEKEAFGQAIADEYAETLKRME